MPESQSINRGSLALNARHTVLVAGSTYLHIHCVDEQGNPLAGAKYKLVLPDGTEEEGELDPDGWVKHDGILRGEGMFYLLEDVVEAEVIHYIDVVVKDEEDRALAGEPYLLRLANGETREGELDDQGHMREEGIPPGPCWFALEGGPTAGDTRHLRLQFMDEDGQPFAGKPFEISVGGDTISGMTSDDGRVIADVPADAEDGELTIWLDEDKSGESYSWPIKISEVAS